MIGSNGFPAIAVLFDAACEYPASKIHVVFRLYGDLWREFEPLEPLAVDLHDPYVEGLVFVSVNKG